MAWHSTKLSVRGQTEKRVTISHLIVCPQPAGAVFQDFDSPPHYRKFLHRFPVSMPTDLAAARFVCFTAGHFTNFGPSRNRVRAGSAGEPGCGAFGEIALPESCFEPSKKTAKKTLT
jgi:hypothetical protein